MSHVSKVFAFCVFRVCTFLNVVYCYLNVFTSMLKAETSP